MESSLRVKVVGSSSDMLISGGEQSIQVKEYSRKLGVYPEVSLSSCPGRAFNILFNVFKRNQSSDSGVLSAY